MPDRGLVIDPEWDWNDLAAMSRDLHPFLQDTFEQSDDPILRNMARSMDTLRPFTLCHGTYCWLSFTWSNGGDYLDRATGEPIVTSIQNAQAFEWLQTHISECASHSWSTCRPILFR